MSEIEQRLTSIFRATFGDEGIVLRPEMTADDVALLLARQQPMTAAER